MLKYTKSKHFIYHASYLMLGICETVNDGFRLRTPIYTQWIFMSYMPKSLLVVDLMILCFR